MARFRIFSGTQLKLFAAICMLIDHIGVIFFPNILIFRIIGRLAFPIFAFMISEGARYTKNKIRYFFTIFSVALICSLVFYLFSGGSLYLCVLVTFSISVLLIYALRWFKVCLYSRNCGLSVKLISLFVFLLLVTAAALLDYLPFFDKVLRLDYDGGFVGAILPVAASLFDYRGIDAPDSVKRLDKLNVRVAVMGVALISMVSISPLQWFALLALIPLLMYSERRGRYSLKYFFYIFYPLHLALLEGLYILIRILSR